MFERPADGDAPQGIFGRLGAAWANLRWRRKKAATVLELSRMDERMLRDIGIDPLDVLDALNGPGRPVLFHPIGAQRFSDGNGVR
jgi:uncharacterized protein YjiS (DUF1127 family)